MNLIVFAPLLFSFCLAFHSPKGHHPTANLFMLALSEERVGDGAMIPPSVSALLSRVYTQTPRNVISASVTGGGITALQWMFTTPGASNSLMDSYIPYRYVDDVRH